MGRSKATVPFCGRPLICRLVERLSPVADELIITTNEPKELAFLQEQYPELGIRFESDVINERGALPGLYTALRCARNPYVAVVACDMVLASPSLVVAEALEMTRTGADVVVPVNKHGFEPFHAIYRRSDCLPAVRAALNEGEKRAQVFFNQVNVCEFPQKKVLEAEPMGGCFMNANSLLGEARRGFFTSATSWTASAAGKTAEMVIRKNLGMQAKDATLREQLGAGASGTLPQFQERRRSQVLDAMDRLGEPVVEQVETRLFGRVEIDASVCNSCGMCAVFCPTGALSKSAIKPSPNADGTPDGGSFLEFSCAECVQCGLCMDACMKKCITVSPQVHTAELFDFEPRFIYLPKPQARPGILSSIKR